MDLAILRVLDELELQYTSVLCFPLFFHQLAF